MGRRHRFWALRMLLALIDRSQAICSSRELTRPQASGKWFMTNDLEEMVCSGVVERSVTDPRFSRLWRLRTKR